MRVTIGSEKRATYVANLAAAGPLEVDAAISQAVRTGDRDLAAAACVRIDGPPCPLPRYPGAKFDEMLVLVSPQGTGKSTALSSLNHAALSPGA